MIFTQYIYHYICVPSLIINSVEAVDEDRKYLYVNVAQLLNDLEAIKDQDSMGNLVTRAIKDVNNEKIKGAANNFDRKYPNWLEEDNTQLVIPVSKVLDM